MQCTLYRLVARFFAAGRANVGWFTGVVLKVDSKLF